jgi:hypothetical protein
MTDPKKRSRTVEEIQAELEADPTYVARREQQEALRRKLDEEARVAEPLVEDLRAVGIRVETVWDLDRVPGETIYNQGRKAAAVGRGIASQRMRVGYETSAKGSHRVRQSEAIIGIVTSSA